ncbi:MAG: hypothetical protein ACOX02_00930 [Acholeplasmatales bacterium]
MKTNYKMTKKDVINELNGLKITRINRFIDMIIVSFETKYGDNFSLHIQCYSKFSSGEDIILDSDMIYMNDGLDLSEDPTISMDTLFDEVLKENESKLVNIKVTNVSFSNNDLKIELENGINLEVFEKEKGDNESYRIFNDKYEFVVAGDYVGYLKKERNFLNKFEVIKLLSNSVLINYSRFLDEILFKCKSENGTIFYFEINVYLRISENNIPIISSKDIFKPLEEKLEQYHFENRGTTLFDKKMDENLKKILYVPIKHVSFENNDLKIVFENNIVFNIIINTTSKRIKYEIINDDFIYRV